MNKSSLQPLRAAIRQIIHGSRREARTARSQPRNGLLIGAGCLLPLVMAAPSAHGADYTFTPAGSWSWTTAANWSPNGVPGATDRAIYASQAGADLGVAFNVGQLVFLGPTSGTNGGQFAGPELTIHGIAGVGVDQQATNVSRLLNRTVIASDQIWRASNATGGGFDFNNFGSGVTYLNLAAYTLTTDLVNAANVARFGEVRGTGNIVKTGLGTLTLLSATNSYTGTTLVQAGTLALSGAGIVSTSSVMNVASGATFDISAITAGTTSIRSLAGAGNVLMGVKSLNLTNANHVFSGVISGTGGLTMTGGTQTLSGANTYQGGTFLNGGVLSIAADNALGDAAGALTFNGGTLRNTAAFSSARAITLAGNSTFQTNAALTLSGAITGPGALNKTGNGALTLAGGSSHTGNTNVSAGELRVENGATVAGTALTRISGINAALTVSGTGSSWETGQMTFAAPGGAIGTLNIANGGEVRTTTSNDLTVNSFLPGSAIVNVSGAGSLLDVSGALAVASVPGFPSGTVNVTGGGTIHSVGGSIGEIAVPTAPKSVTVSGAGSSWVSSNNFVFHNGTLSILDGGTVSAPASTIAPQAGSANLTVAGAGSVYSISGDLSAGAGGGLADRTGTITLANGGRLQVGGQMTVFDSAAARTVLNIGATAAQPAAAAGLLDTATLSFTDGTGTSRINFKHTDSNYTFATAISGGADINQVAGVTNMTGDSSALTGATTVSGGTLRVNGNLGNATSTVSVLSGGTLGGAGTIGGAVTVANGGHLAAGNSPGTLNMGSLTLNSGSVLDFELGEANVAGGSLNDLINVNGDLMLDGTLNVSPSAGTFGAGIYRLINYSGNLTNNGLELGLMPAGSSNYIQTSFANQVNLINTQGLALSYWDGDAGGRNDTLASGGNGTWQAGGNDNWTLSDGSLNARYQDGALPIFGGTAGTVTVDTSLGDVRVTGMQFATDGYRVAGDAITLASGLSSIRVGDGTDSGSAFSATIASALTGAGTLDKTDLGTLVLTGENTYSGNTKISAGTLQLGDGNTSGSILGDVANEGTLGFNRSDDVTFAAVISGGGSLRHVGTGSTTLTGVNTYSGMTTIASGRLALSGAGSIAASSNVVADGVFDISATDAGASITTLSGNGSAVLGTRALTLTAANGSFGGVVDGASGTLNKSGTGTWTLTGAGSNVGTLAVQSGTLELASGASLATNMTTVADGATLRNGGTFTGTAGDDTFALAGAFAGSANFLDGNDEVQITEGANFSQAAFDGGSGVDTLDITSSSALTLPSTLATGFENLIKRGAGGLMLSGTVDEFSDSITISGGSVQLASANILTNQMSIGSGVTVTGTGSLSGSLVNAGVLSLGNSPGTIHVGANYTQAASGTLVSEILRSGTDLLHIAGNASLAGTHQIHIEYGLYLDGTTHTLIQAAGGISGDFDSVQMNTSGLMAANRQLTVNAETVSFARQSFTTLTDAQSGRGRFAAWLEEQIDSGNLTPQMTDYIDSMLQQPTADSAMALLGERSEPTATVTQNSVSILGAGFARTVFERFTMSDAAQCAPTQAATNDTLNCFWAHGLRQWGNAGGDSRYDWTSDGGQIGVDRNLSSGWALGATFGYADTNTQDLNGGQNNVRSRMGGLYANYAPGRLNLGAMAFYSGNDNDTHRTVLVGSTAQQASAEFDTDSYGVGVRLGYRVTSEAGPLVRPFVEAFYDHLDGAEINETGANAGNLSAHVHGRDGLRGTAGLQLADNFEGYGRVFRPALELGVAHQFADARSTLDLQPFSDAPVFRTYGPALDRTAYIARASLNVSLGANASVALGYGGELADDYSQHEGNLSFRMAW